MLLGLTTLANVLFLLRSLGRSLLRFLMATRMPIPGISSIAHLRKNVAGAALVLSAADVEELDKIDC
jgi:aryl-alcohol dehydrogenase-like predicted oxidoreductase